jgi:hypothetical protein
MAIITTSPASSVFETLVRSENALSIHKEVRAMADAASRG